MSNAIVSLVVLFVVVSGLVESSRLNLKDDPTVSSWRETSPKDVSLRTVLAGRCKDHYEVVQGAYSPGDVERFEGGEGLYERITDYLRKTCGARVSNVCPPGTIFINNAESTPLKEIQEIMRSFTRHKYCTLPDLAEGTIDCSLVWFVFSTCLGEDAVNSIGDVGDEDARFALDTIQSEVRVHLRQKWRGVDISNGEIKIIYHSEPSLPNDLTRAKRKRDEEAKSLKGALLMEQEKQVKGGIDIGVLDRGGYVGQDWAMVAVKRALQDIQFGLKFGSGPIIFLFLGPAGTGKTMLSRLLGSAYHGGEDIASLTSRGHFSLFNMAQYNSAEDVDSFLSPRPGLVGHGSMIDVFQHSKKPVIVLDEAEKAHTNLVQAMISWFDENGFVQDKKNASNTFSTRDAIFILTTNCYSKEITHASAESRRDAKVVSDRILSLIESGTRNENLPGCKIFEREDFRRRIKAGHTMANLNQYGFVVFLPPSLEQAEQIGALFLEEHRRHHELSTSRKLYWTDGAQDYMKKLARDKLISSRGKGGMSEIDTALRNEMVRVLRAVASHDCFQSGATLLFVRDRELQAMAFCGEVNSSACDPPNCSIEQIESSVQYAQMVHEPAIEAQSSRAIDQQDDAKQYELELELESTLKVASPIAISNHLDERKEVDVEKNAVLDEQQEADEAMDEEQEHAMELQSRWNWAAEWTVQLMLAVAVALALYFLFSSWFVLSWIFATAVAVFVYIFVLPEELKAILRLGAIAGYKIASFVYGRFGFKWTVIVFLLMYTGTKMLSRKTKFNTSITIGGLGTILMVYDRIFQVIWILLLGGLLIGGTVLVLPPMMMTRMFMEISQRSFDT